MIAAKAAEQDITRLGWIDYVLMGTASALAVFSGAQAVAAADSAWILVALSALGMALSALLQAKLSERFAVSFGGAAYALLVLACLFTWRSFAAGLPDKVLVETRELAPAGFLIFMIVFGSFAAWRDQTLLFQAVPGIAIFGLVGCYDTYRPAPFLFFGFLLCLCTMFARAHARSMLLQAAESGFRARAAQESLTGSAGAGSWVQAIRQGPWKWVAGPEWALASAASVVLISLLGAPVIQRSVSGVSGFVRINVPVRPQNQAQTPSLFPSAGANSGSVRVGQGPNRLSDTPLYKARMDRLRYLRVATYLNYNGTGWDPVRNQAPDPFTLQSGTIAQHARDEIKDPAVIEWEVERIQNSGFTFPAPGEVTELISGGRQLAIGPDGMLFLAATSRRLAVARGRSLVDAGRTQPKYKAGDLPLVLDAALNSDRTTDPVQRLALDTMEGSKDDFEAATRWKNKIAQTVRYNLNAPRTPDGIDPVEHFLFGSKEGYCDLFASAMVQGARIYGIPARYVVGFLPEPDLDSDGRFTLRESDSHAWAELYFEDVGWVIFDATEGAPGVPGGERGETNVGKEWYRQPWAIVLLTLVGGGLIAGITWYAYRRMGAGVPVDPIRRDLDRAYDRFSRTLGRAVGTPRRANQTPDEYFRSVGERLGEAKPQGEELNRFFVDAYYSPERPSEEQLAQARKLIQDLEKSLRKR